MRLRFLLLLLLLLLPASLLQGASPFPAPLGPERLISGPGFGNAPADQREIRIAIGPDIALVAWSDNRAGRETLYVTRVDGDGKVLDPMGVPVHDSARPDAVVWNGEDFLVAGTVFVTEGVAFLFARVSTDGVVLTKTIQRLGLYTYFADAAGFGQDARVVYFDTAPSSTAHVFDGYGNPVREQPLSPPSHGSFIAASRNNGEFLLLRTFFETSRSPRVIAQRLSSDGVWISSLESNLPVAANDARLEGGNDGYLLFRTLPGAGTEIYFLDEGGVWTGKKTTLPIGPASPVFSEDRFLVSWFEQGGVGNRDIYYGEISEEGVLVFYEKVGERIGQAVENRVAAISPTQRLLVTSFFDHPSATQADLTFRLFTPRETSSQSQSLTSSASQQTGVAVAAGSEGFASVWMERGPDAYLRLMFNTFSPRGEASGSPTELARLGCCDVNNYRQFGSFAISSNGSVYLVVWQQTDLRARRFSEHVGWIDPEPFVIASGWNNFSQQSLASDGGNFLLVWSESQEIRARRLPAAGSMDGLSVTLSTGRAHFQPVVASDGTDYMVVWSDGERFCSFLCFLPNFRILASRVGSNGMPINQSPMLLEDRKDYSQAPSIAFDGRNYVVLWHAGIWAAFDLFGIRMKPDGTILEAQTDGRGILLREARSQALIVGMLAPSENGVLLLTNEDDEKPGAWWDGLAIDSEMPLASVLEMPSQRFVDDALPEGAIIYIPLTSLSVAMKGSTHFFGFARISDAEIGRVPRVYTQFRGLLSRFRSIRP